MVRVACLSVRRFPQAIDEGSLRLATSHECLQSAVAMPVLLSSASIEDRIRCVPSKPCCAIPKISQPSLDCRGVQTPGALLRRV